MLYLIEVVLIVDLEIFRSRIGLFEVGEKAYLKFHKLTDTININSHTLLTDFSIFC